MAKEKKSSAGGGGKADRERRLTPTERSDARMRKYLFIALALGCTLPLLVPLLHRLQNVLSPPSYTELTSPTPAQLHGVFFSGTPHVVFCTNRTGTDVPRMVRRLADTIDDMELAEKDYGEGAEAKPSAPAEVLDDVTGAPHAPPLQPFVSALTKEEREKAYRDGGVVSSPLARVSVATMDCEAPLPRSGLSLLSRFRLPPPPVFTLPPGSPPSAAALLPVPAFFVSNGNKPAWIPADLLASRDDLKAPRQILAHVAARGAPRTQVIQSEKFLKRDCLARKHCVLILHSGASGLLSPATIATIRALHATMPFIHVVSVDVRGFTLSLQRNIGKLEEGAARGEEERHKWPRLLYFRRQALPANTTGSDGQAQAAGAGNATSTLLVKSFKGRFSPRPVLDFVSSLADVPRFLPSGLADTSDASGTKGSGSGASRMAILKTPPTLNTGANNFAKVPSAAKLKKEALQRAAKQKAEAAAAAAAAASSQAADAESRAADAAREERERLERRRAEMEAEAAEINFVNVRDSDADAADAEAHGSHHKAEEDAEEETVNLDEDDEDKEL